MALNLACWKWSSLPSSPDLPLPPCDGTTLCSLAQAGEPGHCPTLSQTSGGPVGPTNVSRTGCCHLLRAWSSLLPCVPTAALPSPSPCLHSQTPSRSSHCAWNKTRAPHLAQGSCHSLGPGDLSTVLLLSSSPAGRVWFLKYTELRCPRPS